MSNHIIQSGKFKGVSFEEMRDDQERIDYSRWVYNTNNLYGEINHFKYWLKEQYPTDEQFKISHPISDSEPKDDDVLTIGKHKGKTFSEVAKIKYYSKWVLEQELQEGTSLNQFKKYLQRQ